jgi:hypothetical protein
MTHHLLACSLQQFLAGSRGALVIEDGQVLFDLESAQYSVSSEKDRCLLHLWSQERNLVRQVLAVEEKRGTLTVTVRRFAQARPIKLEICRDRERRPPTALKTARSRYARLLERVLRRAAPDWTLDKARLSTTMDLERSFSPVYARGLLRKGRSAFAVPGREPAGDASRRRCLADLRLALATGLPRARSRTLRRGRPADLRPATELRHSADSPGPSGP